MSCFFLLVKGIKSLEDCLEFDMESISYVGDDQTRSKLDSALSRLGLALWLQKQDLMDALPVLESKGHSSLISLCGVDTRQVGRAQYKVQ